jgi:hypothetical protein
MGREGSRYSRRVLFQVVIRCIRTHASDNDFKEYYARYVARGKPKIKALVRTMGKLPEIIYHCLNAREVYRHQSKYRFLKMSSLPSEENASEVTELA